VPQRDASDLAVGLRAFRDGLIDRDALLAAFAAWERDPAATMAGLLRDRLGATSETVAYTGPPLPGTSNLPPLPEPPEPAGRFRVGRLHATGGLGMVFEAVDAELDRRVALKELQPRLADDEVCRLRFVQEAEITGRLEHPGVVPVYGLGRHPDGRPYYAMRLVEGETFHAAVARFHRGSKGEDRELTFRRLLRSVVEVCYALGYAHSRGVVHRDVKPENVMLGTFGETLLLDWGVAKAVGRPDPSPALPLFEGGPPDLPYMTRPGAAVGTPQYMSPEQAEGDVDRIGPASDVYGVGATLYYLLVGRPPFVGADLADLLGRVRRGVFPSPRRERRSVDPALEAICLKAMATRPEDRHASALELAEAIESWLAAIRYRDEQQEALEQVRDSRARLAVERASTCFHRARDGEGMLWLARALELGPTDRDRGIRASLSAWHRRDRMLERTIANAGAAGPIRFSPDGKRLATAADDGTVRIWDVARATPLGPPLPHPRAVRAMEFTPDGRLLVTGCEGGVVRRWDGLSGSPVAESPPFEAAVVLLHFGADGSCLAALDRDARSWLRDADTGAAVADDPRPLLRASRALLAAAGGTLAAADGDGEVWTWDLSARRRGDRPLPHPDALTAMAVHPAGDRVLTCGRDGLVRIWDAAGATILAERPHHDEVAWAGFAPDGDAFVLVSTPGEARAHATRDGAPLGEPFVHDGRGPAPAFHPDGLVAARGRDGSARLWDAASGLPVGPPLAGGGRSGALAFAPDGRRLAVAGADGAVRIWKAPEPAPGDVERIGLWVRLASGFDFDGDVVRLLDPLAGWEMRRRLQDLGGPPVK